MLMARFEPENNLQTILDGVVLAQDQTTFIVVGNHNTKYGKFLKERYQNYKNILFLGGIFNIEILSSKNIKTVHLLFLSAGKLC